MASEIILLSSLLSLLVESFTPCQHAIVLQDTTPVFLNSPGFTEGKSYPPNTLCSWDVTTYNAVIEVRFLSFDLEYDANCRWDYVKVYSGPCGGNSPTKYCGTSLPPNHLSTDRKVCLEFFSDPVETRTGFRVQLRRLEKPQVKNEKATLSVTSLLSTTTSLPPTTVSMTSMSSSSSSSTIKSTDSQIESSQHLHDSNVTVDMCLSPLFHFDMKRNEKLTLYSPGFQSGDRYPVNLHCSMSIATTPKRVLKIYLHAIDLEYHPDCVYDRLVVRDGPLNISPILVYLCGQHQTSIYQSTSNAIYIEFHSDHIIPAGGFKMIIESDLLSLGTTQASTSFTLVSFAPVSTDAPVSKDSSVSTDVPVSEDSSVSTDVPVSKDSSVSTDVPVSKDSPVSTDVPVSKDSSVSTDVPVSKDSSVSTDVPVSKDSSVSTDVPVSKDSSVSTDVPVSKDSPVSTDVPVSKDSSVSTDVPVSKDSPVSTDVPVSKDSPTSIHISSSEHVSTSTSSELSVPASSSTESFIEPSVNDRIDKSRPNESSSSLSPVQTSTETATSLTPTKSKKTSPVNYFFTSISSLSTTYKTTKEYKPRTTTIESKSTVSAPDTVLGSSKTTTVPLTSHSPSPQNKETLSGVYAKEIWQTKEEQKAVPTTTEPQVTPRSLSQDSSTSTTQQTSSPSTMQQSSSSSSSSSSSTTTTTTTTATAAATTTTAAPSSFLSSTTTTTLSRSTPIVSTTLPSASLPAECLGMDRVFSALGKHDIQSPGAEIGSPYPNNVQCTWVFIAEDGQEIRFAFEMFDIEFEKECKYDSLKIYEGSISKDKMVNQHCGKEIPANRTFSGPQIYLVFTSDRFVQRNGFKMTADIVQTTSEIQKCQLQQKRCARGPCVPAEWFCDGEVDCPNKDDEIYCGQCESKKFRCNNGECISEYLRCDGTPDCTGQEDEFNCFSLTDESELLILHNNKNLPVCRDAWDPNLGRAICADQFSSGMESVWFETSNSLIHVGLKDSISSDTILSRDLMTIITWCPSNERVHLKCKKAECGQLSTNLLQPYILGGSISHRGQWPWTVALMIGNSFLCGGTLVADRWVVTAGHCVESVAKTPYLIRAEFGAVSLRQPGGSSRRVMEVIRHPDHEFIYNADIALLHLQQPVRTDDYTRKACLPQQPQHLTPGLLCYISGWGVTKIEDYYTTVLPDLLHYAKTKLWEQSKCKKAYGSKVKDSMSCAGYDYGGIDSCKGDSGGPLVCRVRGHWVLLGVTTWGDSPCGQLKKPGVYTRVDSFRGWIKDIIEPSGEKLSCDYESPGSCGQVDLSDDMLLWTRQSGGVTATGRPAVDHTFLNISGHYLYAEIPFNSKSDLSPAVLRLPETTGTMCLSLSYVFERPDAIRLKVSFGGKNDIVVHDVWSASKGLSTWSTTNMTVGGNVSRVYITAVPLKTAYSTGVAIDDVTFVEGKCEEDGHISCDFNDDEGCKLFQDESLFRWEPNLDSDGRYMRFNGVNKPPRTKAILYQPLEIMESSYCVKARYKICDDGALSIHTSFVYGEYVITGNAQWSRRHMSGGCSGWQQLSLPMPYKQYPHRVTIQGVVNSQIAEICLDDFQILLGECL